MTYKRSKDPNYLSRLYGRENIPIKGQITMLIHAAEELAFAGAQPPELRDELLDYVHICRKELEDMIADRLNKGSEEIDQ